MLRGRNQLGIALVSVLSVATVCIILAATFSFVITSESRNTTLATQTADSLQVADAATERARMMIVQAYKDSFLTSTNFLKQLDNGSLSTLNKNQITTISVDGKEARWKVSAYALPTDPFQWVEVAATAETAKGVQTVIRRINLGQSEVFTLAMLSQKTDCIYCHLRVNGDVGSLGFLRPGWGTEGSDGIGSGGHSGGSRVNGTVFVAPDPADATAANVSADDANLNSGTKKINGAEFTGEVFTGYTGGRLPTDKDGDGNPDFPAIDKTVAETNANGSISGAALMYTIPSGGSALGSVPTSSNTSSINKTYDGNLILVGTKANPIKLDGDIYVSGDVIIKGYVEGKGAIYSGRNTYVAGNINYVNAPADCFDASNPDACAQQSILDGDDELRIAARGNIILGDYTEQTATGGKKSWQASQASDYYRSQFGFWGGTKSYDKTTGDELSCSASKVCKNADGKDVPVADIIEVPGNDSTAPDAYDYSMRPGSIDATTGAFSEWLSDGLYQQILGTETRKNDHWRYPITRETLRPTNASDPANVQAALDYLRTQMGPAGAQLSDASLRDIMCVDSSYAAISCGNVDLKDNSGNVIGNLTGNGTIYVDIYSAATYEKQITNVDAYLYSNQRIAGKTFKAPLVINGGMVSKEIGILAPGIDPANTTDCSSQAYADQYRDTSLAETDPNYYNGVYNPKADDCALTINYDYRLKNGGFGYNLVAQDVGRTSNWHIADKRSERVPKQ